MATASNGIAQAVSVLSITVPHNTFTTIYEVDTASNAWAIIFPVWWHRGSATASVTGLAGLDTFITPSSTWIQIFGSINYNGTSGTQNVYAYTNSADSDNHGETGRRWSGTDKSLGNYSNGYVLFPGERFKWKQTNGSSASLTCGFKILIYSP